MKRVDPINKIHININIEAKRKSKDYYSKVIKKNKESFNDYFEGAKRKILNDTQ